MKKFLTLLLLLIPIFSASQTCDVEFLVFGLHYDDFDYEPNCTVTTDFHPGWTFVTAGLGWEYFTGDTANFQLNPPFGWDCMLNNPVDGICWEMVVWQINLSQTVDPVDFPNDFWTDTCGVCADQTQMYPDINLFFNLVPRYKPTSPFISRLYGSFS